MIVRQKRPPRTRQRHETTPTTVRLWRVILAAAALLLGPGVAAAQQQQPAPAPVPAPTNPENNEWAKLPRMQLERQFAGPLQDTIIQRWRDPVDGVVCYIYLPITAAHTPPTPTGFVQYGANTIGSISCLVEAARPAPRPDKRPAPEAPKQ